MRGMPEEVRCGRYWERVGRGEIPEMREIICRSRCAGEEIPDMPEVKCSSCRGSGAGGEIPEMPDTKVRDPDKRYSTKGHGMAIAMMNSGCQLSGNGDRG